MNDLTFFEYSMLTIKGMLVIITEHYSAYIHHFFQLLQVDNLNNY